MSQIPDGTDGVGDGDGVGVEPNPAGEETPEHEVHLPEGVTRGPETVRSFRMVRSADAALGAVGG